MNSTNLHTIRIICLISLLLSILSFIIAVIAFWASCDIQYNNENALLSAFSIMVAILLGAVTILIAWQVYNHFVAKDEVRKMIDEEVSKQAIDIWQLLESKDMAQKDRCLLATSDVQDYDKIEVYIKSIEIAKSCKIETLKNYAVNYIMERFHNFYQRLNDQSKKHILRGSRDKYLYICKDVNHVYIDELIHYITDAEDV